MERVGSGWCAVICFDGHLPSCQLFLCDSKTHQKKNCFWSVLVLQLFREVVGEVVFPESVVLRVMPEQRREPLVFQHETAVRRPGPYSDHRSLRAFENQVFRRLRSCGKCDNNDNKKIDVFYDGSSLGNTNHHRYHMGYKVQPGRSFVIFGTFAR